MRSTPPTTLTRGFGNVEAEVISRWWNGLRAENRRSLRRILEERPAWPVVVGRLRLCKEDREEPSRFPLVDLYEYLVNHELSFSEPRIFHICSAHPEARRIAHEGSIASTFTCPFGRTRCPMREMVEYASGEDVAS